jgi:hypothetical protein
MIGTLSFLKAVKKSQTYHMLMISQQLYALWTFAAPKSSFWETRKLQCVILHPTVAKVLKVLKQISMNTYCLRKCVCPVDLRNVNVQQEGAVCCCACQTSALVWNGRVHIPRSK